MSGNQSTSSTQANNLYEKQKKALEHRLFKIMKKEVVKEENVIKLAFDAVKTNHSEVLSLLINISKIPEETLEKLATQLIDAANDNSTEFYQALFENVDMAHVIFDLSHLLPDRYLSNAGLARDCFIAVLPNQAPIFQCAIDKKASDLISKMLRNPRLDIEGVLERLFDQTAKVYRNLMKYAVEEKDQEIFGLLMSRIDEKNLGPKIPSCQNGLLISNDLLISDLDAKELRASLFDTTTLQSLCNFKSHLIEKNSPDQDLIVISNAILRKLLLVINKLFESKDDQKNPILSALMKEASKELKEPKETRETIDECLRNLTRCLENAYSKLKPSWKDKLSAFFTSSHSLEDPLRKLDDLLTIITIISEEKACGLPLMSTSRLS